MKNLTALKTGEKATVLQLCSSGTIRRRLMDIGFISGSAVECIYRSPLGDPTAFLIKGTVIALRQEDSDNIIVDYA